MLKYYGVILHALVFSYTFRCDYIMLTRISYSTRGSQKIRFLFYCHQITSHSEMRLCLLIITSLHCFSSHLCWCTCLGGIPFLKILSIEGWIPITQPCLHLVLHIIMWFELLGMKMFFHVGEEMKVRRCQIRAVGRMLKNFPAPFQKIHCHLSCILSGIVMQQQHPFVWHLRPLMLDSSQVFLSLPDKQQNWLFH